VGCGRPHPSANPGVTTPGYYTAHSADGLRWTLDANVPQWNAIDVVTTAWHPGRRRATIALKRSLRVARIARRSIHTAEYQNGVYSADVSALYPDEYDDMLAQHRGFHSADYYGMGMMPAGADGMVGFLWNYWHQLPYTKGWGSGPQALFGQSDISLVYQMETGGRWMHPPGRQLFIDSQQLPTPAGWINSASNVIQIGDEQRLYFTSRPRSHGFSRDINWEHVPGASSLANSCITYAAWPKDRLFGFQATKDATLRINLGDVDQPGRFAINMSTQESDGEIRAELRANGEIIKPFQDAIPATGDHTAITLNWKTGDIIPPGKNVMVALQLRNATAFAYELLPAGK
jgi:hypothetical protein